MATKKKTEETTNNKAKTTVAKMGSNSESIKSKSTKTKATKSAKTTNATDKPAKKSVKAEKSLTKKPKTKQTNESKQIATELDVQKKSARPKSTSKPVEMLDSPKQKEQTTVKPKAILKSKVSAKLVDPEPKPDKEVAKKAKPKKVEVKYVSKPVDSKVSNSKKTIKEKPATTKTTKKIEKSMLADESDIISKDNSIENIPVDNNNAKIKQAPKAKAEKKLPKTKLPTKELKKVEVNKTVAEVEVKPSKKSNTKEEVKPVTKRISKKTKKVIDQADAKVEKSQKTTKVVVDKPESNNQTKASSKPPLKEDKRRVKVINQPIGSKRYSDEDLELFASRIHEVREEAIDELRMLKERLDDLNSFDFAEESMIYSMHMAEQGSEALEKEKTYAQIQRINEYIKKLDDALLRIKEKTYGICRVCGCLIAKERLLAVPITTLSASYKIHERCPDDGVDRIEPIQK